MDRGGERRLAAADFEVPHGPVLLDGHVHQRVVRRGVSEGVQLGLHGSEPGLAAVARFGLGQHGERLARRGGPLALDAILVGLTAGIAGEHARAPGQ
jgi:hypothetical protein